jgi:tetratricopeptide (TPR) repeat protein
MPRRRYKFASVAEREAVVYGYLNEKVLAMGRCLVEPLIRTPAECHSEPLILVLHRAVRILTHSTSRQVNAHAPALTLPEVYLRNDAMQFLRSRLDKNPKNAMAHHYVAPIVQTTGDIKRAVQHYQCAVTYNKMDLDSMNDLALVLHKVGRPPAVLNCRFSGTNSIGSLPWELFTTIARVSMLDLQGLQAPLAFGYQAPMLSLQGGLSDKALELLKKVLAVNSDHILGNLNISAVYAWKGP